MCAKDVIVASESPSVSTRLKFFSFSYMHSSLNITFSLQKERGCEENLLFHCSISIPLHRFRFSRFSRKMARRPAAARPRIATHCRQQATALPAGRLGPAGPHANHAFHFFVPSANVRKTDEKSRICPTDNGQERPWAQGHVALMRA